MNKNIDSDKFEIDKIETPFNPKDVKIDMKTITIDLLIKRIERGEINLLTDFQRKGNLWDKKKQSQLIESILIRLPLPAFYFDATNDSQWLIVNGLQRIWAIKNFVIDKSLRLQDLEYLEFNGYSFDKLSRELQRRIEETQITTYQIAEGTPADVKFNLFKRINTGGLVLESQEIRHALNQGIPADFIKELAESKEFIEFTNKSISPKRMKDRDIVNRFVAFYLNDYRKYNSELIPFLNESMASLKNLKKTELDNIKNNFFKSLKYSVEIFGDFAFRKIPPTEKKRAPINKALFEIFTVTFSKLKIDNLDKLINNKEILIEYKSLLKNDSFNKSISSDTGGVQSVRSRFSMFENFINKFLKDKNDNAF
jgi:hypothetical protein